MTQTEAKWAERVREWRASGQTAEEFADGRGFKASTLRVWTTRLRGKTVPVAATLRSDGDVRRVPIVRIRRTKETEATRARTATMVIAIGTARIEVQPGFDPKLLGDVVEALGGAR